MTLCLCKRHNKRGLFNSVECVAPVINSLDLNALIQSHCLTFPLGVRGLTNILRVPAWQAGTYSQITAHFIFVVLCWGNQKRGGVSK